MGVNNQKNGCGYSPQTLHAYLTHQLSEEEETAFQRHLFDCPTCATEIERLRAHVMEEKALPEETPQRETFTTPKRVEETPREGKTSPKLLRRTLLGGAAASLLLFVVLRRGDEVHPTQATQSPEFIEMEGGYAPENFNTGAVKGEEPSTASFYVEDSLPSDTATNRAYIYVEP